MTKFYQAKVALGYNNSAKSKVCELLIEAETEQMAYDTINSHFKQVIAHPTKTVYIYSKEVDNYVCVEEDVSESDCYLISADVVSMKESNIVCFWGSSKERVYILKLAVDFICYKSESYIAVGGRDFNEVVDIITKAFSDSRRMAMLFVSGKYIKSITDYDYENADFDVTSLKRSDLILIQELFDI